MTAGRFAELAWALGEAHAEAFEALIGGRNVSLAVAHGQTLFHRPPYSLQLLNPAPIAARLRCRVLCDLRQADLAAGGRGAPITPMADWVLFRDAAQRRAVVNLGGFCNATFLPPGRGGCLHHVRGADLCACNQVLDAIARRTLDAPFDEDGAAARRGTPDAEAVAALVSLLRRQRDEGRSLGTGDEATKWIETELRRLASAPGTAQERSAVAVVPHVGETLAASAVEAIGAVITEAVNEHREECEEDRHRASGLDGAQDPVEILLAGGGARNAALVAAITRSSLGPVTTTAACGIPIEAREAVAMAVLGALAEDDAEITLEAVTGRRDRAGRPGVWMG